ncbi:hypothetical protein ACLBX9_12920 [Methylobacterium sp. A49B]
MSDKPDMKALAEQVRAFAQTPRMQELKRQVEALRQSPPEHIRKLRDDLKEFSARQRMQLGPRGQSGVEPQPSGKRGRGRPKGAHYSNDAAIIAQIRSELLRTGELDVEPVALRFVRQAGGGGTPKSKARRLTRRYMKQYGRPREQ